MPERVVHEHFWIGLLWGLGSSLALVALGFLLAAGVGVWLG
jgi:ABC-type nitrate/sulfonate/bicarbonate transport system permease component